MRNLKMLAFMAAMANVDVDKPQTTSSNKDVIKKRPIKKVIPKGCKEYFFSNSGHFTLSKTDGTNITFTCIASSDKVAVKKFKKYINNN